MQKIIFTIILILFVFSSNTIFAQVDRSVSPNLATPPKAEPIDPLVSAMTYLKKELSLDAFQEAAIKIYVKENFEASDKIRFSDLPETEKTNQIEQIIKNFDQKVIKILNPDQIKVYEELQKKRTKKKDKAKKKKGSNDEE